VSNLRGIHLVGVKRSGILSTVSLIARLFFATGFLLVTSPAISKVCAAGMTTDWMDSASAIVASLYGLPTPIAPSDGEANVQEGQPTFFWPRRLDARPTYRRLYEETFELFIDGVQDPLDDPAYNWHLAKSSHAPGLHTWFVRRSSRLARSSNPYLIEDSCIRSFTITSSATGNYKTTAQLLTGAKTANRPRTFPRPDTSPTLTEFINDLQTQPKKSSYDITLSINYFDLRVYNNHRTEPISNSNFFNFLYTMNTSAFIFRIFPSAIGECKIGSTNKDCYLQTAIDHAAAFSNPVLNQIFNFSDSFTSASCNDQCYRSTMLELAKFYDWTADVLPMRPVNNYKFSLGETPAQGDHLALTDTLRGQILFAALERARQIHDYYLDPTLVQVNASYLGLTPLDSHGSYTLNHLTQTLLIMAGLTPGVDAGAAQAEQLMRVKLQNPTWSLRANVDKWLHDAMSYYIASYSPWGAFATDGGFANGTAYALLNSEETFTWNALRWATGMDMRERASVKNFGKYLTYFTPPGSPAGVFGDATSGNPLQDNVAQYLYLSQFSNERFPFIYNPLYKWFLQELNSDINAGIKSASAIMTSQWSNGYIANLFALPVSSNVQAFPDATSPSAKFDSIGWMAIHNQFSSRDGVRNSIYFKSSPFGSYNHSNADQNSFVIHQQNRALLINSGIYFSDPNFNFNSDYRRYWAKQTRAQNAITFDSSQISSNQDRFDGQGQNLGPIDRPSNWTTGLITKNARLVSSANNSNFDWVVGDATAAYTYDGDLSLSLSKATRGLVYLRGNLANNLPQDIVLIYDNLASALGGVAHQWELNFHSLYPFTNSSLGIGSSYVVEAADGSGAKACINIYPNQSLEQANNGINQYKTIQKPAAPPIAAVPLLPDIPKNYHQYQTYDLKVKVSTKTTEASFLTIIYLNSCDTPNPINIIQPSGGSQQWSITLGNRTVRFDDKIVVVN
jgi:Heparinase II/III-like protein